jgi:uncharacterized membrane protein
MKISKNNLEALNRYKKRDAVSCGCNICQVCGEDFSMYDLNQNICVKCLKKMGTSNEKK